MRTQTFDLKLATGKTVQWEGKDGEDAARRYVDAFPDTCVVAWRYPKYQFVPGMIEIQEV